MAKANRLRRSSQFKNETERHTTRHDTKALSYIAALVASYLDSQKGAATNLSIYWENIAL